MIFDSINPANGEKVNSFERMSDDEVQLILRKCAEAQRGWANTPFGERARLLTAVADLLLENRHTYAQMMTEEMGKVYAQGIAEVEKCAWGCRYYAEHAQRFLAPEDVATEAHHSFVSYKPLGVVLAIMPWNFPLWQVFRFAAPALMAGNAALLKHAPNVFGCALLIEKIFAEAGLPANLFRSLIIDVPQTTRVIHNPLVAAVSITSSVAAGRAVASEAACWNSAVLTLLSCSRMRISIRRWRSGLLAVSRTVVRAVSRQNALSSSSPSTRNSKGNLSTRPAG